MFIETQSGSWINETEIREIRSERREVHGGHIWEHIADLRDGRSVLVFGSSGATLSLSGALVASRPGDTAVLVTVIDNGQGLVETLIEDVPIVAWRVIAGSDDDLIARPVLSSERSSNQEVGVLMPDGQVDAAFEATYENRAAFAVNVLENYQHRERAKRLRAASAA